MTASITIEKDVHFRRLACGRQELHEDVIASPTMQSAERVPRLARLMALAIRFDGLLVMGQVRDQADLARLGQVTRARISQILGLIHLAPDIQEEILFLRGAGRGLDLLLADVRPLCAVSDWNGQRRRWRALRARLGASPDGAKPTRWRPSAFPRTVPPPVRIQCGD
jgi:hypothetical protein